MRHVIARYAAHYNGRRPHRACNFARHVPIIPPWIPAAGAAEDLSEIRTGHGPANMAALRNLALGRHRFVGATNIAAACRRVARHPNRVLPLLT